MMPQYANPATYRFSGQNLAIGMTIFVIGLLKKSMLADPASASVAHGFAHAGDLTVLAAWTTALSYSLQLYFDFSGYSDMAIGLARMFNVIFPLNFNSPYRSTSVVEYWQRWHMTLTRYLNLLLFNPIAMWVTRWRAGHGYATSRKAQATLGGFSSMILLPTFTTMALIGIWHGAGLQYLIFGLLHGFYLSVNHFFRIFRPKQKPTESATGGSIVVHVLKVLATYLAVLFALMFFRASSTGAALQMIAGLVGFHATGLGQLPPLRDIVWFAALYLIIFAFPNTQQLMGRYEPALGLGRMVAAPRLSWQPSLGWAVALGLGAAMAIVAIGGTSEFLYFQF
jgi:D-alanyl-lipoteichoic acid acyltransferase DltB (MBOAT superfamily)